MKKLLSILLIIGFLTGGVFWGYAAQPSQYKVNAGDARWNTKLNAGLDALWGNITDFATLITGWAIEDNMVVLIPATPTYSNGTTFTVPGDYTSRLTAGKVVQVRLAASTVETTVVSSTYAAPTTTVVLTDSMLTNPVIRIYVVATRDGLWPNGPGYVVAADYGTDQAALAAADGLAAAAGKQLVIGYAYSITSDLTLSSNIKVMPGVPFAIATTKTLTINGGLEAGLYQIFSLTGTGTIVGDPKVHAIYPEWFGAKGDNTTDDAAAINAAANLARTAGCKRIKLAGSGASGYLVAAQLDLRQLNVEGAGLITTTYAGAAVLVGAYGGLDISLRVSRVYAVDNWDAGNIGILVSDCRNSRLALAASNHEIGIQFLAGSTDGCYNTITLGYVTGNKKGLQVYVPAGVTGWVNDNLVLSGNFGNPRAGATCAVELLSEGAGSIDKWTFIKPCIEYNLSTAGAVGFIFDKASMCQVHDARWESDTGKIAKFLNTAHDNIITLGSFDFTHGPIDWDEAGPTVDSWGNDVRMSAEPAPKRLNDTTTFDAAYHDGTYLHVPGFQFFDSDGVVYRKTNHGDLNLMDRGKGAAVNVGGGLCYGFGLMVRFTGTLDYAKKLYVQARGSLSNPYLGVICFDSSMNILSGTTPYYVKGRKCNSNGNYYYLSAISPHNVLLFDTNVAYALVGVMASYNDANYTSGLDISSAYTADAYVTYTGPFEYPGKLCASQAPTKWHFKVGDTVRHDAPAVGTTQGWTCIKRTETTITANASGGATTITVASIAGLASGDVIGVKLNTGFYHFTTINGAPSGSTVTLTAAVPGAGVVATSGNAVVANLWAAMPVL